MNTILSVNNVVKSFFGTYALKNVSFELERGEILTFLGENGSGKSTLMNVLTGVYQMDIDSGGSLVFDGRPMVFNAPSDSLAVGIGMVHQHFALVEALSVYENILISLPKLPFILNNKKLKNYISSFIAEFELSFDVDMPMNRLSVGEQQWVEIIKLLIRECKVLILDEPTAVLTPQETVKFFSFLKKLKEQGKSIIFISHKMKEVMELSDRVVILKKGVVVDILRRDEFEQNDLARLMIGGDAVPDWERKSSVHEETILQLNNIDFINERGVKELNSFTLTLRRGEILGITGVSGNGQKALAEALTGLKDVSSGAIIVNGENITNSDSRHTYIAGIAHIPEDRKSMGIAPDLSIEENLVMKNFRQSRFRRYGILQDSVAIEEYAKSKIEKFAVKTESSKTQIRLLSGGNIQKVIIARELSGNPLVLVALYPTRGLDIGSAEYVYKVMNDAVAKGMSIILISEDLEELFKVSDRLAVIFRGKIVGEVEPSKTTREDIGILMSGGKLS